MARVVEDETVAFTGLFTELLQLQLHMQSL